MEDSAPYNCQIAATPCPANCGSPQCVPPLVSHLAAAGWPLPLAHVLDAGQIELLRDNAECCNARTLELLNRLLAHYDELRFGAARAAPDQSAGPFSIGAQRRAEQLQHEYFAMKHRAEAAEAELNRTRWHIAARDEELRCAESFMAEYLETEVYPQVTSGDATLARIRRLLAVAPSRPAL